MKQLLILCLIATTAIAGTQPPVAPPAPAPVDWLTFIQGVSNAHTLTVAFAPTYSSKLNSRWGASMEVGYPLNDFLEVLVRGDILDNNYFAAAGGAKAKVDFQLFGHNVTPYVETLVVSPLNNAGDQLHDVGALIGSGMKIEIWKHKNVVLSGLGEVDYITYYPGIQVYRLGGQATIHF